MSDPRALAAGGLRAARLFAEGWKVNVKHVHRVWRREGLEFPKKQAKRSCLWPSEGSALRFQPKRASHVWRHDFVHDRTQDDRPSVQNAYDH